MSVSISASWSTFAGSATRTGSARCGRFQLRGALLFSGLAILASTMCLSNGEPDNQCPPIPPDASAACPSLFNEEASSIGRSGLQASWLVPEHAVVHQFNYEGSVGSSVSCEVPGDTVTCRGVDYPSSCFQCLAVQAPFARIPAAQRPSGDFTAYDHGLNLTYSVKIDGSERHRTVYYPPSLRVVVQTRQLAQIQRDVRWDYRDRSPVIVLERYEVDHHSPEEGVDATVDIWVDFPAWVKAAAIRVDSLSDGIEAPRPAELVQDCDSAGTNDDCQQLFRFHLHAPDYWRCNFNTDIGFTLVLTCRHPSGCPDFSDGTEFPLKIWLKTDTWCPHDPWDRLGLLNQLFAYADAGHSRPNRGALNWNNEYFFRYTTSALFEITNTRLEWINVTHPLRATEDGPIWDGESVNTELVSSDHLKVRCPPDTPSNECQFDFTLDPSDPLWEGVREDAFVTINLHVVGRVGYKDEDRPGRLVHRLIPIAWDGGNVAQVPRAGEAPTRLLKVMSIGEEPKPSESTPMLFYGGIGMLSVGTLFLATAAMVAWKNKRLVSRMSVSEHTPLRGA